MSRGLAGSPCSLVPFPVVTVAFIADSEGPGSAFSPMAINQAPQGLLLNIFHVWEASVRADKTGDHTDPASRSLCGLSGTHILWSALILRWT